MVVDTPYRLYLVPARDGTGHDLYCLTPGHVEMANLDATEIGIAGLNVPPGEVGRIPTGMMDGNALHNIHAKACDYVIS